MNKSLAIIGASVLGLVTGVAVINIVDDQTHFISGVQAEPVEVKSAPVAVTPKPVNTVTVKDTYGYSYTFNRADMKVIRDEDSIGDCNFRTGSVGDYELGQFSEYVRDFCEKGNQVSYDVKANGVMTSLDGKTKHVSELAYNCKKDDATLTQYSMSADLLFNTTAGPNVLIGHFPITQIPAVYVQQKEMMGGGRTYYSQNVRYTPTGSSRVQAGHYSNRNHVVCVAARKLGMF